MAYIGREPQVGNFQVCDAISVVNGQAASTMQVSSTNVSPETANHVLCSLNGVLQKPGSSFTVSGSTITFASNLVTGDVIDFVQILGSTLDLGVPSDGTVSGSKLAATAITGQTAETSVADDDLILIHDTSAGALRKMTKVNFAGSANIISDADSDTKIQVEEGSDEDTIRYDIAGAEVATQTARGLEFTSVGGFVMNQTTNSQTFSIASTENAMVAGPIAFTGTITVEGTLVII